MIYYDIHTHQPARYPEDIVVISVDAGRLKLPGPIIPQANNYYSVGIHPWHVDMKSMDYVCEYASRPTVVAIGETGLDKIAAKDECEFRLQQELFSAHAELSEATRKPLIIHCVKAWDELLHIHKSIKPVMPWIIHGFRGKELLASQLINAGLYLSFGKYYHEEALLIAWQKQRLLIETDDKDVDLHTIYEQIAGDLNISKETLAEAISRFFKNQLLTSR